MKIKEETIRQLDGLNTGDLYLVHDMVLSMKAKRAKPPIDKELYLKSREALKDLKGSLSADVISMRSERI